MTIWSGNSYFVEFFIVSCHLFAFLQYAVLKYRVDEVIRRTKDIINIVNSVSSVSVLLLTIQEMVKPLNLSGSGYSCNPLKSVANQYVLFGFNFLGASFYFSFLK